MEPNVIIEDGEFKTTVYLKAGSLLLHDDFPLGLSMRDFKEGHILDYDPSRNTQDVTIKAEWTRVSI